MGVDLTKITCEHCRPKPDPEMAKMPPEYFVGKFVVKTFATGIKRSPGEEFVYFADQRVCRVLGVSSCGKNLQCRLSTHPLFSLSNVFRDCQLPGEEVFIRPDEVEQVYEHFCSPVDSG
jgi:hypothetical protein